MGNCPNFVCNLSSLSSSQIDALVDQENKMRAEYAKAKGIANIYRVVSSLPFFFSSVPVFPDHFPTIFPFCFYNEIKRVTSAWKNPSLLPTSCTMFLYPNSTPLINERLLSAPIPKIPTPIFEEFKSQKHSFSTMKFCAVLGSAFGQNGAQKGANVLTAHVRR